MRIIIVRPTLSLLFLSLALVFNAVRLPAQTVLHAAAEGDGDSLTRLLDGGQPLDLRDPHGRAALHHAAAKGHGDTVELLLARGAVIDASDAGGRTALHLAARAGHPAMVARLAARGAGVDCRDEHGRTPLAEAAIHGHAACASALLSLGANPDAAEDEGGRTPLHWAAESGHEDLVKALLAGGAAADQRDREGRTPLAAALKQGHYAAARVLLQGGARPDPDDPEFAKQLLEAVRTDDAEAVRMLIQQGCEPGAACPANGGELLLTAVKADALQALQALLDSGVPPDALPVPTGRLTALIQAVNTAKVPFAQALVKAGADCTHALRGTVLLSGNEGFINTTSARMAAGGFTVRGTRYVLARLLLEGGADLAVLEGRDPLAAAVRAGDTELLDLLLEYAPLTASSTPELMKDALWGKDAAMVNFLLDRGIPATLRLDKGRTLLHEALDQGLDELLQGLLLRGVEVDAVDDFGRTPLHAAAIMADSTAASLLLSQGASIFLADNYGDLPQHLLVRPSRLHEGGLWGAGPIHPEENWRRDFRGRLDFMQMLVEHGADLNLLNESMQSVFDLAVHGHHPEAFRYLPEMGATHGPGYDVRSAAFLDAARDGDLAALMAGRESVIDLNVRDPNGESALYFAAKHNHPECVEWLLGEGARLEARNLLGETPLYAAAVSGATETIHLLARHGAHTRPVPHRGGEALYDAMVHGRYDAAETLLRLEAAGVGRRDGPPRNWIEIRRTLTPGVWTRLLPSMSREEASLLFPALLEDAAQESLAFVQILLSDANPARDAALRSHSALAKASTEVYEYLLDHGFPLDVVGRNGRTPLEAAAESGDVDQVAAYLRRGADVNVRSPRGGGALNLALAGGHRDIVELLLEAGAEVNPTTGTHLTPLQTALCSWQFGLADRLLELGADPNLPCHQGISPLNFAIALRHSGLVEKLLARGANPNASPLAGEAQPVVRAVEYPGVSPRYRVGISTVTDPNRPDLLPSRNPRDSVSILEQLQEAGADFRLTFADDRTLPVFALRQKRIDEYAWLVMKAFGGDLADPFAERGVAFAIQRSATDAVRRLLKEGLDPNTANGEGRTPLFLAVQAGRPEMVQVLLDGGAAAHWRDAQGNSLLHWAVIHGDTPEAARTVAMLVETGADLEAVDALGRTPLLRAAEAGAVALVKQLAALGADWSARDDEGLTPILRAALAGREESVLALRGLGAGRDIHEAAATDNLPILTHALRADAALLTAVDHAGRTPLHWAAALGRMNALRFLIREGAPLDAVDEAWRTPYDLAIVHRQAEAGALLFESLYGARPPEIP